MEPYLDAEGRIKLLPRRRDRREAMLRYLAASLEPGRDYTEPEVNLHIEHWHRFGDVCLVRRMLIESRLLQRTPDGRRYWRAEPVQVD